MEFGVGAWLRLKCASRKIRCSSIFHFSFSLPNLVFCVSPHQRPQFYSFPFGSFLKNNYAFIYFYFYFTFLFLRAAPTAYEGFQARGLIRATAAGLHHSYSNAGSLTHWVRPGIEPTTSWFLVRFLSDVPDGNS